jgi:hypothetical protein
MVLQLPFALSCQRSFILVQSAPHAPRIHGSTSPSKISRQCPMTSFCWSVIPDFTFLHLVKLFWYEVGPMIEHLACRSAFQAAKAATSCKSAVGEQHMSVFLFVRCDAKRCTVVCLLYSKSTTPTKSDDRSKCPTLTIFLQTGIDGGYVRHPASL